MANSIMHRHLSNKSPNAVDRDNPVVQVRRLVLRLAIATLLLMAVGSATRVMNAGLACPDWPLCYGQLLPGQQMNLQVFLEWFHRLDAALVSCGAIALTVLSIWHRKALPKWLPWAAFLAMFLIGLQASLGALTVTELLRFDLVTAHLGTALLFFSLLVAMGAALIPYAANGNAGYLSWFGSAAALFVYLQSIVGGLVASRWALHQCFAASQLCAVMNSHMIGVLPPTLSVFLLVFLVRRTAALSPILRQLAMLAGGLLMAQIALGIATFRLHLQVEPLTVTHQAAGAALLGSLVAFAVLAFRDRAAPNIDGEGGGQSLDGKV